ncbi:ATPase family protein associated with various cellular activities (AAA) [Pseudomonas baetica]|uniref:ATPase family protein associated with various cellular activities (AAA) n=1 Tax=Pseudomonas baetica TaxID=674054 RepID=A0ABX4PQW8_9PSED|nr:ATP-binding protein [Pseudomonas baetica]PKA67419.1 ATPase family protein associated with various cellular activities (AAA) [Pseudomonas baetica]PTC18660.1 AAA family ATPase [Pseudomonas baetica]
MATAQQIIALLSSHNQGDEEQFLSIALQVAAAEARRGRRDTADELKALVDSARKRDPLTKAQKPGPNQQVAIPISKPRGELEALLSVSYPKSQLRDLILDRPKQERLTRLIHQQRQRDKLRSHGLAPSSKLLLVGPPGSGKTLTASILAGELRLPLFTIRLDALMTRFMGETASKLRLIFDQIASVRAVYLFDEFDAIGGRRNADNDVGEMRRVLNSFLQFLEEANSTDSLVLATTNHPELLDRALFRRFDDIVEYSLPDANGIKEILEMRIHSYLPSRVPWAKLVAAAKGLSQAEITRAASEIIKDVILLEEKHASTEAIVNALKERHSLKETMSGLTLG